ncbi:hypothetical protein V8C42DRAFT_353250 [Trichoderma barbatum]
MALYHSATLPVATYYSGFLPDLPRPGCGISVHQVCIREHTAYSLAKYGISKLAITDVNLKGLETVAANIKKQWPSAQVLTLELDVSKSEQAKSVLSQVVAQFGRLNIALNNAGITGQAGKVDELGESDWHRVLSINLNGVHFYLGPRRGRGSIINVSSLYGLIKPLCPIYYTAYAAATHEPTPSRTRAPTHVKEAPLGRLGQPEEMTDSIVFLASPLSSFVNGFGLAVDGGYSCV